MLLLVHATAVLLLWAVLDSLQVLTAGMDGQLHLLPMGWERGSAAAASQTCYSDQEGYVSYHAAQWSSIDTFVTASTTGELAYYQSCSASQTPACTRAQLYSRGQQFPCSPCNPEEKSCVCFVEHPVNELVSCTILSCNTSVMQLLSHTFAAQKEGLGCGRTSKRSVYKPVLSKSLKFKQQLL